MVRRIVKVGAVIAVAILAAIFLLPGFITPGQGFLTFLTVGTPQGEEVIIYSEDPAFSPQTIIRIQGVTVDYLFWSTSFLAESPDYTQYTIPTGQAVLGLRNPDGTRCGANIKSLSFSPTGLYDVGTRYSVGKDLIGTADGSTIRVTAARILAQIDNNGCPTSGTFTLRYLIQLQVEASGIGDLPKDTVIKTYETPITLAEGSITLTEDTTSGSG